MVVYSLLDVRTQSGTVLMAQGEVVEFRFDEHAVNLDPQDLVEWCSGRNITVVPVEHASFWDGAYKITCNDPDVAFEFKMRWL